jgi:hypothetical protein
MSIPRWNPRHTISEHEQFLLSRLQRTRKLFAFLRLYRHELFDDKFQDELAQMYRSTGAGKTPCPPALLAMAALLQGYLRVSDAEAVELTAMDKRWQLVLDRLGADKPAFGQGTLGDFRGRMIRTDMDRRLLERTAELAKKTQGFDPKKLPKSLRVAIDSAPLQGAGRVEDTINLLWHAARKLVQGVALLMEWEEEAVCRTAGVPLLRSSSAKAGLDVDWSDPEQKGWALDRLMEQVDSLVVWMSQHQPEAMRLPPLAQYVETLQQVIEQDLEPDPDPDGPGLRIKKGVAKDRRISIEDAQMRHGRKSKHERIDGYKRPVATDLVTKLILACWVTPANRPEAEATPALEQDLSRQGLGVDELYIDQAYAHSQMAQRTLARGGTVYCRPRNTSNGDCFGKEDFVLNWEQGTLTCPAGQTQPIQLGQSVRFPPAVCAPCSLRAQCTRAQPERGRTVSIAPDEALQEQRRQAIKTPQGRAELRHRVGVEHRLAHIAYRQGPRARYLGVRKNLYDLRRTATIQNLETIQQGGPLRMAA